jgi:hypothetical protein
MSEEKFRRYLELNYNIEKIKHENTFEWAVNALEDMDIKLGMDSHRISKLEEFCKEFVYGEENPQYYKTMTEKVERLEYKLKKALEVIKFYAEHHNWDFSCTIWDGDWEPLNSNALTKNLLVGGKKARDFLKEEENK